MVSAATGGRAADGGLSPAAPGPPAGEPPHQPPAPRPEPRDRTLAEPRSGRSLQRWGDYGARSGAMEALTEARDRIVAAQEAEAIRRLVVRRFGFELPSEKPVSHPLFDLQGLIEQLLE